jgi:hypothetical protein
MPGYIMRGATPLLPNTPPWHGAQLKKKHRDNFTFTLHTKMHPEKMKGRDHFGELDVDGNITQI